jgi:plasmid stabilization system protein ParE
VKRPVVFRRAARVEFDAAHKWYEQQRPGLGQTFSDRVHEALQRIAAVPTAHQMIYKDVRRAIVQGFPYSVLYRIQPSRIQVIALFHSSRDPSVWQGRV